MKFTALYLAAACIVSTLSGVGADAKTSFRKHKASDNPQMTPDAYQKKLATYQSDLTAFQIVSNNFTNDENSFQSLKAAYLAKQADDDVLMAKLQKQSDEDYAAFKQQVDDWNESYRQQQADLASKEADFEVYAEETTANLDAKEAKVEADLDAASKLHEQLLKAVGDFQQAAADFNPSAAVTSSAFKKLKSKVVKSASKGPKVYQPQGDVDALMDNIATLAKAKTDFNTNKKSAYAARNDFWAQRAQLEGAETANYKRFDKLAADLIAAKSDFAATQAQQQADLKAAVAAFQLKKDKFEASVEQREQEIASLESKLSALEASCKEIQNDFADLESTVGGIFKSLPQ